MGPNWAKLVSEGRAKAINTPFSDEDWDLIKSGKKTPQEIQDEFNGETDKKADEETPKKAKEEADKKAKEETDKKAK